MPRSALPATTHRYIHQYLLISGKDIPGIHELTFHAIMKCDPDCLKELSSNIILSGGSSNYSGMIERLTKEVFFKNLLILVKRSFTILHKTQGHRTT